MKKRLRKKLAKLAGMSRIVMLNQKTGHVCFDWTPWGGTEAFFQPPIPPQIRLGKRVKLQAPTYYGRIFS